MKLWMLGDTSNYILFGHIGRFSNWHLINNTPPPWPPFPLSYHWSWGRRQQCQNHPSLPDNLDIIGVAATDATKADKFDCQISMTTQSLNITNWVGEVHNRNEFKHHRTNFPIAMPNTNFVCYFVLPRCEKHDFFEAPLSVNVLHAQLF